MSITPLHNFNDESVERFRILLSEGHDPNARDRFGNTPLHKASSPEIIKVLISYGADPSLKNDSGETPLDVNIERTNFGSDEIREKKRRIVTILSNPHVSIIGVIEDAHDEIIELKEIIKHLNDELEIVRKENANITQELNSCKITSSKKPKQVQKKEKVWVCENPFKKNSQSVQDRLDSCEPDSENLEVDGKKRFGNRVDCMAKCHT